MSIRDRHHDGLADAPASIHAALRMSRHLLADEPARHAHCEAAAAQALHTAGQLLRPEDAEAVAIAAALHDIGYSRQVARTGFHPLDGALHLFRSGFPDLVVQLVAQHSHAGVLAPSYGVETHLSLIGHAPAALADALTYCDLRAGHDGRTTTVAERIADMRRRHAARDRGIVPEEVREMRYALLRSTGDRVATAIRESVAAV